MLFLFLALAFRIARTLVKQDRNIRRTKHYPVPFSVALLKNSLSIHLHLQASQNSPPSKSLLTMRATHRCITITWVFSLHTKHGRS